MTPASERRRMIRFLVHGGCIVRDSAPEPLASYWTRATRSGDHWSAQTGDRLVKRGGCVLKGQRYAMVKAFGGGSVYTLKEQAPA